MRKKINLKMTGVQARFLLRLLAYVNEELDGYLYRDKPVLDITYYEILEESNKLSVIFDELHFLLRRKGLVDCLTKEEMLTHLKLKRQDTKLL